MIKVKMIDLLNSMQTLQKISDQELNGLLAYKIGKALYTIDNEMSLYESSRKEIINKYCVKDQNNKIKIYENGTTQIQKQYIEDYNKEITELNNLEIELNIIELEEDDLKIFNLKPKEIISIFWWIKK